jgi:hypothetical protein
VSRAFNSNNAGTTDIYHQLSKMARAHAVKYSVIATVRQASYLRIGLELTRVLTIKRCCLQDVLH